MDTIRKPWEVDCAVTFIALLYNREQPVEAEQSLSSVGKDSH